MSSTDADWKKWGEQDPYFGVISDARFSKENIASSRAIFYRTGEEQIEMFLAQAEDAIGPIPRGAALDFGCGTGRLVLPLASRFDHAVGVDIADGMLAQARSEAVDRQLTNVTFSNYLSDGAFDFVHTYIVLQHIPPARGMAIINKLLDLVAVNGVAMIQVVVQRPRCKKYRFRYFLHHSVPGIRQLHNLLRGKPVNAPTMQMNEYDSAEIMKLFAAKNFGNILAYPEYNGGILSVRYVARKAKYPYEAQFESPDFGGGSKHAVSDVVRKALTA